MKIRMGSLLVGAEEAEGTAIIIDVFRAFTTAAIAFTMGAEKIILVSSAHEALDLRSRGLGHFCMGEMGGMRPDGFDFGNSPFELSQADVSDKTLIQSTMAGTVGVVAARRAKHIYVGSLVIAEATVKAISHRSPELVSIVAMGSEGMVRTDEDEQCALYIRNLLQGRKPDREAVRALVLAGMESQKYGDPSRPHFHHEDKEIALQIDKFRFAIKVSREDGLLVASPEII